MNQEPAIALATIGALLAQIAVHVYGKWKEAKGHDAGRTEGEAIGHDAGYDAGYDAGKIDGIAEGWRRGWSRPRDTNGRFIKPNPNL